MANFDVLKNFITQRVYTNGTQAITGKVMQDTLLEMLKAWGYQFQGFATPETVPPATANDYRPYYLANAKGTYTNFGGAVLDGSTLAMLYYDGSWKSQVLSIGGGGGTGNFVTLNTEQTITGVKTFSSTAYFSGQPGILLNRLGSWRYIRFTKNSEATAEWDIASGGINGLDTTLQLRSFGEYVTLSLTHDNRVGINTASPIYTLDVNGSLRTSSLAIFQGNEVQLGSNTNRWNLRCTETNFYIIPANSDSVITTLRPLWIDHDTGAIGSNCSITCYNNITAAKLITSGGTSAQFVKGDGSLDSNTYLTTTAASTGYVTLNTVQTITAEKKFTFGIGIILGSSSGSSAQALSFFKTGTDDIFGSFGCLTDKNTLSCMYISWTSVNPWELQNNFSVNSTDIKYKNNTVWHAGNDGSGSGLDADLLDGQHGPYYATASGWVKKTGDTMTGTLTLDTIKSSAPYLTFSTQLYIGNATDTNNTVNQGSIRTIGGISASLSIWAGKNITASGEVTAISDIRTKSDIRSLTFRGACRPVSFIKDGKRGIGFIAQEVQKLYPELVVEGADGLLSLNYACYTAVLQSQVDNHETELQRLRGRVEELERKNEELSRRLGYGK